MWLVVGLGNPGSQYSLTRHNIGFMAIDYWLKALKSPHENQQFKAQTAKFKVEDTQVLTVKPQTYMNLSGDSVRPALDFYKIPLTQMIVIHDDIDQPFGSMKIQKNRGHGGHNGIRHITEVMGTADYLRLKLGVGRPPHPSMQVADYVLQKFSPEEMNELPAFLEKSCDAIESILFEGHQKASTKFNS